MRYFYLGLKTTFVTLSVFHLWGYSVAWGTVDNQQNITESSSSISVDPQQEKPPSVLAEGTDTVAVAQSSLAHPTSTMGINLRMDAQYSGGGTLSQGFAIPSVRLSSFGEIGNHLNYRLSLGQTKEFSTANLPPIIPVEAYVVFRVTSDKSDSSSNLRLKAGLFSPAFNSMWTPDLTDVNIPDFNETHRALFLSREGGAELSYLPFKKIVEVTVGAFNGTGVFAQNTNNGKAFTLHLKTTFSLGTWNLSLGTGNYSLKQAEPKTVNYKFNTVSDLFLEIKSDSLRTQLFVDAFTGHFADNVKSLNALGGSIVASVGVNSWLGIFGKYEYSNRSPILSSCIRQFQIGPEIYYDDNLRTFLTFTQSEAGGTHDKSLMIRMRLNV